MWMNEFTIGVCVYVFCTFISGPLFYHFYILFLFYDYKYYFVESLLKLITSVFNTIFV